MLTYENVEMLKNSIYLYDLSTPSLMRTYTPENCHELSLKLFQQ